LSLTLLSIHVQYDACTQSAAVATALAAAAAAAAVQTVSNVSKCRLSATAVPAQSYIKVRSDMQPSDTCAGFDGMHVTNNTRTTVSTAALSSTNTHKVEMPH
jgi:hypothetical protein